MYLLNRESDVFYVRMRQQFTFHYVSIKSLDLYSNGDLYMNLHSTMYLLNQPNIDFATGIKKIYIPLCIY